MTIIRRERTSYGTVSMLVDQLSVNGRIKRFVVRVLMEIHHRVGAVMMTAAMNVVVVQEDLGKVIADHQGEDEAEDRLAQTLRVQTAAVVEDIAAVVDG